MTTGGQWGNAAPPHYPFSALVGQERMTLALLLTAVNPAIGGVLVRGEKGSAKSTAARSLGALLPEIEVVAGCPFACHPARPFEGCPHCRGAERRAERRPVRVVELPLGATEDRVLGTLDLERALRAGERHFEPGLLAAAHRGVLYVDEVNLLPDHLVDLLLDAAAMGRNVVEREGVSFAHPARFTLIGTMNPEEGELRPQLLDRFGLSAEASGPADPRERAEIVRRRIAYETDPAAFAASWAAAEEATRARLRAACEALPTVRLGDDMLDLTAHLCAGVGAAGLRADLAISKAACALAAWEGRSEVAADDVRRVAELALPHRRRRRPFEDSGLDPERLDDLMREHRERRAATPPAIPGDAPASDEPGAPGSANEGKEPETEVFPPAAVAPVPLPPERPARRLPAGERARRGPAARAPVGGRAHGPARPADAANGGDGALALAATLRAAAPHQAARRTPDPEQGGDPAATAFALLPADLRVRRREMPAGQCILFVVDASGSMAAERRMAVAKGAVRNMLLDAYQRRDRVGLIVFRGARAELVLPPTDSVELAERRLRALPTGGRTPLADGLRLAANTLRRPEYAGRSPLIVVLSDGRANVSLTGAAPLEDAHAQARALRDAGVRALVLDSEAGGTRLGLARQLAVELGADYRPLHDLGPDRVGALVRAALDADAARD